MAPKIDLSQALNNQMFAVQESKNGSKKSKDLLQLATILQGLEEEITSTKGAISSSQVVPAANNSQGSATSPFGEAMAGLAYMMQMLEVAISKADHDKAKNDYALAQAHMKLAQTQYDEVQKKLQDIADEQAKQKTIDFWTKFAEIAAACIVTGIALAFGQVEIAVMTIAMTAMSVSGAFEDIANGVSDVLQDCGVPKLTADIVAKVLVLVVVIALTFYCAPESAAGEAVDTGTEIGEEATDSVEMTETAGSSAGSTASTTATDATSETSKLGKVLKATKAFLQRNVRANLIVSNTLQTLSQINLNEIIDEIPQDKLSDKAKKDLELALEITLIVLTLLSSMATAVSMSGGVTSGTSRAARLVSKSKNLVKIGQLISSTLAKGVNGAALVSAETARLGAVLVASALQIAEGAILIKQGNLTKDLANATANMDLLQVYMQMMNSSALSTLKHDANVQQQHASSDKHFQETFAAGEKAFAQLFTTYSPV